MNSKKQFEQKGLSLVLWNCGVGPPVHIVSIMRIMDDFYRKVGTEFIEGLLGFKNDVLLHLYAKEGILALEDYNRNSLTLQIKSKDRDKLIEQIATEDWNTMGALYKLAQIKELLR